MLKVYAPLSAVLRLQTPVDFDAIDGAPVDLLFVLLVPEAATDEHLELLRQIANSNMAGDFTHTAIAVHTLEQAAMIKALVA